MRVVLTLARFALLEARRSGLPWLVLSGIAVGLGMAGFLARIALTESHETQTVVVAALFRLCAVFLVAVLVITSGGNRVDDRKVVQQLGQDIGKADADFVRAQTGFVIGGVPPLAHAEPPYTLMDEDLLRYAAIWPAAGHPNTMFSISPQDLARVTGAKVTDVAQEKKP